MPVTNPSAKAQGLKAEFSSVLKETRSKVPEWVGKLFKQSTSDGAYEDYYASEESPLFRPWPNGKPRVPQGRSDMSKRLYNADWELTLEWNENDEADDRAPAGLKLMDDARAAARNHARDDERIAKVLTTGTADKTVFTDIPTCIDGYAFYSASHTIGTNIKATTSPTTVAEMKALFWAVKKIFRDMRMPNNTTEAYWHPDDIDNAEWLIVGPDSREELFAETFLNPQHMIFSATTDQSYAATPNNIVKAEHRIKPVTWHRLSGNDIFFFMLTGDDGRRPFIKQTRQDLKNDVWERSNSDRTRNTKMKGVGWDWRGGYGYLAPGSSVMFDSSN